MEEMLKEVRLKNVRGSRGDLVLIVENIPKRLVYTKIAKKVPAAELLRSLVSDL